MEYLSVIKIAKKWNLSDRTIRNYRSKGKIPGAFLIGKTWNIPSNTIRPDRINIKKLLENYNNKKSKSLDDIIAFHHDFERIHPFQDGNGRLGRLIMFKVCLANNIIPFIITNNLKLYYYRGLKEWSKEKGILTNTILTVQDQYKKYLEYFKKKLI